MRPSTLDAAPLTERQKELQRRVIQIGLGVIAVVVAILILQNVAISPIPEELVGKWRIVRGSIKGSTYEFQSDGRFRGQIKMGGRVGLMKSNVRVEGNWLIFDTPNPVTRKSTVTRKAIRKLTEREVILNDEKGDLILNRAAPSNTQTTASS